MNDLEKTIKHFESLQKRYTTEHNGQMCERVADALEALHCFAEREVDTIKDINSWKLVTEEFPPILPKVYRRSNYTYRNTERVLLVVDQTNGTRMVKEGYAEVYDDGAVCWKIPGTIKEVTHWMHMPELPEPVEWVHSYAIIDRDKDNRIDTSITCGNCGYIETTHLHYDKCYKCNALWDMCCERVADTLDALRLY